MKQISNRILVFALLSSSMAVHAQTPDDAIRQSYQIPQGTARNMAIGGAGGSLGGDLSAAYINPAGLGFYRTGEVVLSPGFNLFSNKYNFRGDELKDSKNNFSYGPMGLVFGWQNRWDHRKTTAFSISVNQMANFNNNVHYRGLNNATSWTEQYLEELARNRADTNAALDNYIFGSSLAFRTFLVDTASENGVFNGYRSLVDVASGVYQENNIITRGGIHEINIGLASNNSDKFYFGGSLGIPIYSYTKDQTYTETDATNNPNNNFASFTYREQYTSRGVGINLKLGAIYRPAEKWRIGLSLHSPTFANMTDRIRSSIVANTEAYAGTRTASSDNLNNGQPGLYRYVMTTPWKGILSGSYVFNEVSDVRRQRAFLTADIEYIRHQGTQYNITETGTDDDANYYRSVNDVIDDRFKGAFNFRVGGEIKFSPFMFRAGFARYGNPYRISELKNNRTLGSLGVGWRNKGMFIDLTETFTMSKDTNVPYYLSDVPNTFAQGNNRRNNILLTVGFKF